MPVHIPISGRSPEPEPPPYGGLGEAGWARGKTFLELVEEDAERGAALERAYRALDVGADIAAFFASDSRRARVLVLGDLDAVDTRFNVAHAERLFAFGSSIWMRVFSASDNLDLVRLFVGTRHDMPLFVCFGDDRREFARWGPRPRALQELESAPGSPAEATERDSQRRAFYERDRGQALADELRTILATRLGA